MLAVLNDTWHRHDHGLLLLAASLSVAGCVSLFLLLQRSLDFGPRRRGQWSAIAALTGGVGVWATHFLAMLAHRDEMPMTYSFGLTAFSVVEVIAFLWLALRVAAAWTGVWRQIAAGALCVVGIGVMHFTGMAAIEGGVAVHYALAPVGSAIAIATACFVAAFLLFARMRGYRQVAAPAALAIAGVCILHFTVMSATTMAMAGPATTGYAGLDRVWLSGAIVIATGLLVITTALAMLLDRYLTDLRGLADATLEGLAIVHGERIVEANRRFAHMLGLQPHMVVGASPAQWLVATDHRTLLVARDGPVEAMLLAGGAVAAGKDERLFEIATHAIEYRGRECLVLAVRDLTEKRAAQRKIEHMARHDALTGLPNRSLFEERLTHALAQSAQDASPVALIALDLDRFKAVNDIFGHAAGDDVLRRVGAILDGAARASDTVARIGGDEFLILQTGEAQPDGAQALIGRIFAQFASELDTTRDPTAVGVSVGVAVFPNDANDAESLRRGADIALYRAKQSGRGIACFFDQQMDAAARERRALEHDLRQAILRRQIHAVFQPLVTTATGQISGYEALMRWDHPERGEISPERFVPIAEDTGSIVQLGEWILREACETAVHWPDDLVLAVNVSPVQFQIANLPEIVARILRETGFAAHRLELEVTESVLMKDRDSALAILVRLKMLGVQIVMDDFGTGYSSLSNLQSFPFDKIKIDRSFVAAMEHDAAARSIIRAIVGIGRSLALPVLAEGVETEAQHRMVIEEGCPQAQGYLFGHPSGCHGRCRRVRRSCVRRHDLSVAARAVSPPAASDARDAADRRFDNRDRSSVKPIRQAVSFP